MSGALITLMENGWVDWVTATGANLYHDLHRAFDFPMSQGHFQVDHNELKDAGIARIYDVFIQEGDTMIETDRTIIGAFINREFSQPVSTADVHAILGQEVNRRASQSGKSFVGRAAALGVPVYVASPGDSSVGMNLVINYLEGNRVPVDPSLDVLDTAALLRMAKKNGALMVGGGPSDYGQSAEKRPWTPLPRSPLIAALTRSSSAPIPLRTIRWNWPHPSPVIVPAWSQQVRSASHFHAEASLKRNYHLSTRVRMVRDVMTQTTKSTATTTRSDLSVGPKDATSKRSWI